MSKLPSVVSSIPQDLKAFINQVREALDGRSGEKFVTVNDLIRGGLAAPGPSNTIVPPAGVVGTPATPKNVQANGAIQNIIVTWDDPLYNGHAYAEVWGSSTDNLGEAVQVGMTPGAIFVDAVGPSVIRYYWVRFVNVLGVQGAFNAVAGVRGETGADVDYLLDVLTGQITESQLFTSLGTKINNIAVNTTAIQTEATVRANADSSLASQITTVQASVGSNTTAIQQEATARVNADNSLFAQYTVKIDINGYVSGFGLASTANNATPFSEFAVRADRFYVASPSGPGITPIIPFIVNTTSQTVNGVAVPPGVYMDAAFVKNGTITNTKIGNAAIDDAKIVSLTAAKLTAGDISVGNYIQSTGFITGSQGWRIHGNGTAEFAAASIRGTLTAAQINSNGLSIRDTNGNIILNAGTGNFTGSLDGTAASTVVSNASTALSTANSASSAASSAQSTANSAVTTANSASTTATTANTTANSALAGLSNKISNDARNVLSGGGGIAIGSLAWDTSGNRTSGSGIGITRAGIASFNPSGGATFILNGSNGDASFSGTLSAAGGTFAGTLTAQAINAVNTVNIAGNAVTIPLTATGAQGVAFNTSTSATIRTSSAFYPANTSITALFTALKTQFGRGDIYVVLNCLTSSNDLVATFAGAGAGNLIQTMGPNGDKVAAVFSGSYIIPYDGNFKVEAIVSNNFGDQWVADYCTIIVLGSKR
jgi:hypothetical protein